ncbi:DUF3016 domain-containing protein [Pseudidiomarina sp. 1APR75-33.1]|uniref:DUF3016 domain-containing protein n=1 Tax=Pseudidiomarina terrestris TaxID=2820060 RepID=UPI002656023E|nr:DUF3016 domain-containing protein [Pseudidiomarina sp. 1APR75-33.1]MDN7128186.1 DUF3016 domain-containing protein [Pseudidiomarina sp. 1APR75-33.1]
MKTKTILATTIVAAIMSATASAAEVTVAWQNVDDYRDIEAVSDIQERFEKRVMERLTAHWQDLGEKLPEDHKLAVTMTDLDLAGRIEPTYGVGGSGHIRVLDSLSFPTMSFSYTYTDANGEVISSNEDVRLKDLGDGASTLRSVHGTSDDTLYREKQLMTEWVRRQFDVR